VQQKCFSDLILPVTVDLVNSQRRIQTLFLNGNRTGKCETGRTGSPRKPVCPDEKSNWHAAGSYQLTG